MSARGNTVLVVALVTALSTVVWAEPPEDPQGPRGGPEKMGRGHGSGMGMRGPHGILERVLDNPEMVEELGLSKDQVETLKTTAYDLQKEMIAKRAEMEVAALEQARILKDEESSEAALMSAIEKTGRIRTDMAKMGMKRLLLIRETLTEEQRGKLKGLVHKHMRSGRRGHGKTDSPDRQDRREKWSQRRGDRQRAPQSQRPPRREDPQDDDDDDDNED